MRLFKLHRDADETGVSGTGVVAEGVEFHDGLAEEIRWSWEAFIKKYPGLKHADGTPSPYFIAQEAHAVGWLDGHAEASGPKDERRVVTSPLVFHADDGQTDRWQPGEQFEVLHRYNDRVLVERGNVTGWITSTALEEGTQEAPPL